MASYVVFGAISGLGGALVAYLVGHVSPELAFWVSSGDFVFVAVLGGTGSVFAPLVGSVAFEFVKNYALKFSPNTWQLTSRRVPAAGHPLSSRRDCGTLFTRFQRQAMMARR